MDQDALRAGGPQKVVDLHESSDITPLRTLVDRCRADSSEGRVLIGVVGEPGAGKSHLTGRLDRALGKDSVLVPMDGFHLANRVLEDLGARGRKGAPDTFDADGFVHLVRRLRGQREEVVYAPDFVREVDEPIAGAIPVHRSTPVVLVEGNYLLLDEPPWDEVRTCLDATWYVQLDPEVRLRRLAARHRQHGLAAEEAERWARVQDERNARLVRGTRSRADVVISVS